MHTAAPNKEQTVRNILIFTLVTLSCGFVGKALDGLLFSQSSQMGLGALVWLVLPLAANLLLRTFGGDGWQDFGLRPYLKTAWVWYLIALLIPTMITCIVVALGVALRTTTLPGFFERGMGAYLSAAGTVLIAVMIKNIFEEFAWRGYLTPRFESLKLHPFANAILTGFIWAGWHIPYYLYFLDRSELQKQTSLNVPVLIALSFLVLPFQALAYGELRLVSRTVWTSWLMHTTANLISMPLVSLGFVALIGGFPGMLLSPATEGVIYAFLMGCFGFILYRYRSNLPVQEFHK